MSRKDYIATAGILNARRTLHPGVALLIARDLADMFSRDNPRFDRGRFLAACGFSSEG